MFERAYSDLPNIMQKQVKVKTEERRRKQILRRYILQELPFSSLERGMEKLEVVRREEERRKVIEKC